MTRPQGSGTDTERVVTDIATSLAADDLFVLRRISERRFVHVGGVGRGEGWAGVIELTLDDESAIEQAHRGGRPVWHRTPEPQWIFGPYYARSAAIVPVDHDIIVVLGSADPTFAEPQPSDDTLRHNGALAAQAIDRVSPAKRLADELEILHAVAVVTEHCAASVDDALHHVVTTAAASLSCELGVIYLSQGDRSALVQRGWSLGDDAVRAVDAVRDLWHEVDQLPRCLQDAQAAPLAAPLDPDHGIRSYYLVPIGRPAIGMLVLAHTDAVPRGFTMLCQRLGLRLTAAAESLLRTALLREDLEVQLARIDRDARTDALTGLANRMAWQEAIRDPQGSAAQPAGMSVIVLDLNGLKMANDTLGHEVGDRLLCALAQAVRDSVRDGDLVARVGGDEIAVLLPDADEAVCNSVVTRLEAAITAGPAIEGLRLTAAIGAASIPPLPSLADALKTADRRMYAQKASQRAITPEAWQPATPSPSQAPHGTGARARERQQ